MKQDLTKENGFVKLRTAALPDQWKQYESVYEINCPGGAAIGVMQYPTMNCQLGSVASFNQILRLVEKCDEKLKDVELLAYLKEIDKLAVKNIILVDIHEVYTKNMAFLKQSYIVKDIEYTSTNGSKMHIWLINMKKLRENNFTK